MLNTQPKRRSILSRILNPKYIMVYSTVAVFLVIYLVGAIAYGDKGFTSLRTFLLLFTDNAYIGISAVGMTMVLITGGIDLSVAAVASLTGMFIAYGNTILGINPFICIGFALVVGVGLGLLMGATIHYLNVPPFITTLTGMFLARGVCSLISRESISISNEAIDALAGWKVYFVHLVDGQWEKIFTEKPPVFTREEKRAWLDQLTDVTLGSDAFFPFSDNIERAHKSGVKFIAQPGGSVRDDAVIETCNKYGIVMAFTGIRLFHH